MGKDLLEKAIRSGNLNHKNIHFHQLHYFLEKDHGIHKDLCFGEKIITSYAEMDQYWHSYAWIVKQQWDRTWLQLERDNSNKKIHLIDHGCGQALGTVLLLDKYENEIAKRITKLTLIEPSKICITRASRIVNMYKNKFNANFDIEAINLDFDSIKPEDIAYDPGSVIMHLFSNTLDVDNFNHVRYMLSLIETVHPQKFLCVSSHRDHNGGTRRFKDIHKLFSTQEANAKQTIHTKAPRIFNHRKTMKAVSMEIKINEHVASK